VAVQVQGTVAHGGEDEGVLQPQLRGKSRLQGWLAALFIPNDLDTIRLFAQIGSQLHGFPERIDGGVGNLGGIQKEMVPVDGIVCRVPHGGQQDAAAFRLGVEIADVARGP
jgi:hypothetical protein